jgi:hypothetical protein
LELADNKIVIMPVGAWTGVLFFVGMPTNVSFPCTLRC